MDNLLVRIHFIIVMIRWTGLLQEEQARIGVGLIDEGLARLLVARADIVKDATCATLRFPLVDFHHFFQGALGERMCEQRKRCQKEEKSSLG